VTAEAPRIAVLVGIPEAIRARVEQRFKGRVMICTIPIKRDGGFILEPPPSHAARLVEQYADSAPAYERVLVLLLPYARIPVEVAGVATALEELSATVIRPAPDVPPWPPRPRQMDKPFQDHLQGAICMAIDAVFPDSSVKDFDDQDVACELLRGLASHSKMGPNNHSHENDLWKARGQHLGPGGREKIVQQLFGAGILGRKKNMSAGGTGWVYWIADTQKAEALCPALAPYFK